MRFRKFAPICVGLAFAAACETQSVETVEGSFLEESGEQAEAEAQALVGSEIVRLTTQSGAELIFIDEASEDGSAVGVEIVSETGTERLDAILREDPSALELFLAIAPQQEPPQKLLRDHQQIAERSEKHTEIPRTFALPAYESSGNFYCNNEPAWENSFVSWAANLSGEFIGTNMTSPYGFRGYMGYSPRFYVDVCRPADVTSYVPDLYYTGIERRSNSGSAWVRVSQQRHALNREQKRWRYYRYSFGCTSYQYRVHVIHGSGVFHLGASYASQNSCATTL